MSDTNHPVEARFSGRRWVIPNLLPLGFGIVLVLWVASSYDFTRRLEDVEQTTTAIMGRFVQSERLLSSIQVQLLLGSLYLRDAVADTPTADDYYRRQLQSSREQVDAALRDFRPMLDSPEELRVFGTLRGEIADFWSLVAEVLTTRGTRSSMEARVELRRRVIPKRDVILNVLEQVQTLHRGAFDAQRTRGVAGVPRHADTRLDAARDRVRSQPGCRGPGHTLPITGSKLRSSDRLSATRSILGTSSDCPPGWCRPRRTSAVQSHESCTTRLGSR